VYSRQAPLSPGEEWYYELDGRTHGPLPRTDLEDLLNRSGDTADDVRVRRGPDGPWIPFRSTSMRDRPSVASFSKPVAEIPANERRSVSQRPGILSQGVGGLIRDQRGVLAAVAAWLLLNILFIALWPEPYSRERHYLETLRAIEAEKQLLRAKPASESEWQEFAQRTRSDLAPIVKDLQKSASAAQPIRQQLFWSARDLVPRTLGPRTKERDDVERRLRQYLDTVERELARSRT
jgi:hypothetical protein